MMERNKIPANEHFTYDLLSGKQMDQKRRGLVALKNEAYNSLARLRDFVGEQNPQNLANFDKAMYDIKNVSIPSLQSILCGEYYCPAMDEPLRTYGL